MILKSYLKEATVFIESLGETLDLRQLSARAQLEILAQYNDEATRPFVAAVSVRAGVPSWSDLTNDDILDMLTMEQITEINAAIVGIGEDDPKLAPTRRVSSISG